MPGWAHKPNFIFDGDYAYTHDHVRVYSVYVYKASPNLKDTDLVAYCNDAYGPVKACQLYHYRTGIVTYYRAEDAARMLRKIEHKFKNWFCFVKASFSWLQPNCDFAVRRGLPPHSGSSCSGDSNNNNDKTDAMPIVSPVGLLDLNEYCLLHIIKHMKLQDAIQLARSSERLREVFRSSVSFKYKTFELKVLHELTLWQTRDLFRICGDCIEVIAGSLEDLDSRLTILGFIGQNCSNLKKVYLRSNHLNTTALRKIFHANSPVEEVHLELCSLDDKALVPLKYLRNLKVLGLPHNFEITGGHLKDLRRLRELRLNHCVNLRTFALSFAVSNMPYLQTLDIRKSGRVVMRTVLKCLADNCRRLERLSISCDQPECKMVAQLDQLKELFLEARYTQFLDTDFFQRLVKRYHSCLELLRIHATGVIDLEKARLIARLQKLKQLFLIKNDGITNEVLEEFAKLQDLEALQMKRCRNFNAKALLNFVGSCKKLKWLYIEDCIDFDENVVFEMGNLLKTQVKAKERHHKMILKLDGTECDNSFKEKVNQLHGRFPLQIVYKKIIHKDAWEYVPVTDAFDGLSISTDFSQLASDEDTMFETDEGLAERMRIFPHLFAPGYDREDEIDFNFGNLDIFGRNVGAQVIYDDGVLLHEVHDFFD